MGIPLFCSSLGMGAITCRAAGKRLALGSRGPTSSQRADGGPCLTLDSAANQAKATAVAQLRELADGFGILTHLALAFVVFTNAAVEHTVRGYAVANSINAFALVFGDGDYIGGQLRHLENYHAATGAFNGEETYSLDAAVTPARPVYTKREGGHMAILSVQTSVFGGLNYTSSSASVADSFANDGKTFLLFTNGNVSARTLTIAANDAEKPGFGTIVTPDTVVTIPGSGHQRRPLHRRPVPDRAVQRPGHRPRNLRHRRGDGPYRFRHQAGDLRMTAIGTHTIRRIGELTVNIRLSKPLRFRLWLGLGIVRFGVAVMGCSVNVEEDNAWRSSPHAPATRYRWPGRSTVARQHGTGRGRGVRPEEGGRTGRSPSRWSTACTLPRTG